jgi:hypothetical protein
MFVWLNVCLVVFEIDCESFVLLPLVILSLSSLHSTISADVMSGAIC